MTGLHTGLLTWRAVVFRQQTENKQGNNARTARTLWPQLRPPRPAARAPQPVASEVTSGKPTLFQSLDKPGTRAHSVPHDRPTRHLHPLRQARPLSRRHPRPHRRPPARRRSRPRLRRPRHLLQVPGRPGLRRLPQARRHRPPTPPSRRGTPSRSATTASAASPPAAASAARPAPRRRRHRRAARNARSTSRSSASAPRPAPSTMDPATRLYYVEVAEPDMHEPSGDLAAPRAGAAPSSGSSTRVKGDLRTLQMLQPALRKGDWKVTCRRPPRRPGAAHPPRLARLLRGRASTASPSTSARPPSPAISATSPTGEVLASAGLMNPQIRFGEDLMSRVSYAMMNPGGAREMTARRAHRPERPRRPGRRRGRHRPATLIFEAVIVGNPIMHHLAARHRPDRARPGPLRARHRRRAQPLGRARSSFACTSDARIYFLPCIAGHVGADAAAVALSEAPEPLRGA